MVALAVLVVLVLVMAVSPSAAAGNFTVNSQVAEGRWEVTCTPETGHKANWVANYSVAGKNVSVYALNLNTEDVNMNNADMFVVSFDAYRNVDGNSPLTDNVWVMVNSNGVANRGLIETNAQARNWFTMHPNLNTDTLVSIAETVTTNKNLIELHPQIRNEYFGQLNANKCNYKNVRSRGN